MSWIRGHLPGSFAGFLWNKNRSLIEVLLGFKFWKVSIKSKVVWKRIICSRIVWILDNSKELPWGIVWKQSGGVWSPDSGTERNYHLDISKGNCLEKLSEMVWPNYLNGLKLPIWTAIGNQIEMINLFNPKRLQLENLKTLSRVSDRIWNPFHNYEISLECALCGIWRRNCVKN